MYIIELFLFHIYPLFAVFISKDTHTLDGYIKNIPIDIVNNY